RVTRNGGGDGREDGSLSPLRGGRGVGFPSRGTWPLRRGLCGQLPRRQIPCTRARGRAGPDHPRHGGHSVVGWHPACGQAGAPPQAPARGPPLLSRSVTTTFTAPEGVRIF